MTAMWAALQFLTIAPSLIRRPFRETELGHAVGYFPLAGLLLGAVLAVANGAMAAALPTGVRAIAVVALWLVLTGGLHFDGLLDTCDGLLGGRTAEARLRIMRDERVGAFAVAGGVILLLAKHAAVSSLVHPAATLLMSTVLARWAVALAIVGFPYAREEGLGRAMKDHAGPREVLLATLFTAVVMIAVWAVMPAGRGAVWRGATGAVLAGAATVYWARKQLPGLTGDVYGALIEVIETVVLLAGTL